MARGKNISVFLIDGVANGKIKAQISNWNGIAYKIPREFLSECKDLDAFQQSGVYFLFGYKSVYVGQAEVRKSGKGIHQRILDHESDKYKDCWDEVVIFTTKDNSLGRTDISYLENRFYNKALKANRYFLQNGVEPTIGTVTEEKEDELEEFMDQAELILGALGYKVFEHERMTHTKEISQPHEEIILSMPKNTVPPLPEKGDSRWSNEYFHTEKPFMKRYIKGKTDNKSTDGKYVRFWSEIFTFGETEVYISKEWYPNHFELFNLWYLSLQ